MIVTSWSKSFGSITSWELASALFTSGAAGTEAVAMETTSVLLTGGVVKVELVEVKMEVAAVAVTSAVLAGDVSN